MKKISKSERSSDGMTREPILTPAMGEMIDTWRWAMAPGPA